MNVNHSLSPIYAFFSAEKKLDDFNQLIENFNSKGKQDFAPVCFLRLTNNRCSWLLSELSPNEPLAFGSADLGCPEMGYIDLSEIITLKSPLCRPYLVPSFTGTNPLSEYNRVAQKLGSISDAVAKLHRSP